MIPKKILNLFPTWEYQCPNCQTYAEDVAFCPNCKMQFDVLKWRVPPRFLESKQAMSEYAHKVLAPKLNPQQRGLLFKYFTEIFSDGFESNDFSAWTDTSTAGSGAINVVSDQKHHGTYSAKVTGVDAIGDSAFAYKIITDTKEVYLRTYIRIDTLPASGEEGNFAPYIRDILNNNKYSGNLILQRTAGGVLQAGVRYDDTGGTHLSWVNQSYSANTWYCVELRVKHAAGTGIIQLWWDDNQIINLTGLNNDYLIDRVYVGSGMWYGTPFAVNSWFDCVIAADTYIGPEKGYMILIDTTEIGILEKIEEELNGHEVAIVRLANDSSNRTLISTDKDVQIEWNTTVIFTGILKGADYRRGTLHCKVYNKCYEKMENKFFTGTYSATAANTILAAICAAAGVTAGSCPSTLVSVRFDNATCLDSAQFIADAVNKDFWSVGLTFNIGDRGTAKGSITVISEPKRGIDRAKQKNRVLIRGVDEEGNIIYGEAKSTGWTAETDRPIAFTEKKASDASSLDNIAAKKLIEFEKESSGVKVDVSPDTGNTIYPGDTVTLSRPDLELDGNYRVWKTAKKMDKTALEVDRPEVILERYMERTKRYEDLGIYLVSKDQVADGSIVESKIADSAVTTPKIDDLAVQAEKIDVNAVTTTKINDLAVTNAKIGSAAITEAKIDNLAVTTAKIDDLAVETAKIDDLAVSNAKIANATIQTAKIADAAITTAKIEDASITKLKLVDGNVTIEKLHSDTPYLAYFARGKMHISFEALTGYTTITSGGGSAVFEGKNSLLLQTGIIAPPSTAGIRSTIQATKFEWKNKLKIRMSYSFDSTDDLNYFCIADGSPLTSFTKGFGIVAKKVGANVRFYATYNDGTFSSWVISAQYVEKAGTSGYVTLEARHFGTEIKFYVDGTLVYTSSTYIPTTGACYAEFAICTNPITELNNAVRIIIFESQMEW